MDDAETIAVSLPAELKRAVDESVAAGEFASPDEALRDAVRLWRLHRDEDRARIAIARDHIRRSLDDPAASMTADEARGRLRGFMDARERAAPDAAR